MTIDIPAKVLSDALEHTGARTKQAAILAAVEQFNRRKRLERLAERLYGSMPNFMTQKDLEMVREDASWEAGNRVDMEVWSQELLQLRTEYRTGKAGSSAEQILEEDRTDRV